jgi:enoyl-CoA hydratase/carnithine racemase
MGVQINTSEPIWVIEINRPERRNALDSSTAQNITFMLEEANASSVCRAVVLTGVGKWFSAGSDLKELVGRDPEGMAQIEKSKAALARAISDAAVPVVASVSGFALGGGLSVAAACDYVVAEPDSKWHMPEVLNGWLPPWGIEPVIARCGSVRARHVLWGVEPMQAARAHEMGLVDIISNLGQALSESMALAERLAKLPAAAARSVKRYVASPDRRSSEDADNYASRRFVMHCSMSEAKQTFEKFGGAK